MLYASSPVIFRLFGIHLFSKVLRDGHYPFFFVCVLGEKSRRACNLRASSWHSSLLSPSVVNKTDLSLCAVYNQDPLSALILPVLLKLCIMNLQVQHAEFLL